MNTETNESYNAPEGTEIVTGVLILIANYWAKGATINEAWKALTEFSGRGKREIQRGEHIIYTYFDIVAKEPAKDKELTVRTYVNDMGGVTYPSAYPAIEIHRK